jgi:hypothetical protein
LNKRRISGKHSISTIKNTLFRRKIKNYFKTQESFEQTQSTFCVSNANVYEIQEEFGSFSKYMGFYKWKPIINNPKETLIRRSCHSPLDAISTDLKKAWF